MDNRLRKALIRLFLLPLLWLATTGTPAQEAFAQEVPSIEGQWVFTLQWLGTEPFTDEVLVRQWERMLLIETASGQTGLGLIQDPWVIFVFPVDCTPFYVGQISGDAMHGGMCCTLNVALGTWTASAITTGDLSRR